MASTAKKTEKKKNDEQKSIGPFIRSKSKTGFRRGGIQFTSEWLDVGALDLTDGQKELIEKELELGKKSNLLIKESGEE